MHSHFKKINFVSVLQYVLSSPSRSWFSGKIIASHAMASGSIPEGRILPATAHFALERKMMGSSGKQANV